MRRHPDKESSTMLPGHKPSDPKLMQYIAQRLADFGARTPSRVAVDSAAEQVTLSGRMLCEHEQHPAVRARHGLDGIPRLVDLLKVMATAHRQQALPRPPHCMAASAEPRQAANPGNNPTNAEQSAQ